MARAPLTPLAIQRIKPPATGREDYPDGATPGLNLRVSAHDNWVWTLRMRDSAGELRRFTLGTYTPAQGLKWARDQAEALRQKVRREGHDPHIERKAAAASAQARKERARLTLGVLVDDWQRILAGRSPRYIAEAGRALKRAFADQWDRAACDLDRATVVGGLDGLRRPPTTKTKTAPKGKGMVTTRQAIAGRTAAYGRACYGWAAKRGAVPANPFLALPQQGATTARDRVLSDDELAAIWHAAGKATAPFGSLVRMLILTGQRREEVTGMEWAHVSDDLAVWTIPGAQTKNGRPHIVPLIQAAQDILRTMERSAGLVFRGRVGTKFSGWSKSKAELDTAAGVTGWRIHDLRRTLATGLQRLGVRLEVTEAVLNHISGSRSGIVGVYQRHDWKAEKGAALALWADHIKGVLDGKEQGDNVIQLRARGQR